MTYINPNRYFFNRFLVPNPPVERKTGDFAQTENGTGVVISTQIVSPALKSQARLADNGIDGNIAFHERADALILSEGTLTAIRFAGKTEAESALEPFPSNQIGLSLAVELTPFFATDEYILSWTSPKFWSETEVLVAIKSDIATGRPLTRYLWDGTGYIGTPTPGVGDSANYFYDAETHTALMFLRLGNSPLINLGENTRVLHIDFDTEDVTLVAKRKADSYNKILIPAAGSSPELTVNASFDTLSPNYGLLTRFSPEYLRDRYAEYKDGILYAVAKITYSFGNYMLPTASWVEFTLPSDPEDYLELNFDKFDVFPTTTDFADYLETIGPVALSQGFYVGNNFQANLGSEAEEGRVALNSSELGGHVYTTAQNFENTTRYFLKVDIDKSLPFFEFEECGTTPYSGVPETYFSSVRVSDNELALAYTNDFFFRMYNRETTAENFVLAKEIDFTDVAVANHIWADPLPLGEVKANARSNQGFWLDNNTFLMSMFIIDSEGEFIYVWPVKPRSEILAQYPSRAAAEAAEGLLSYDYVNTFKFGSLTDVLKVSETEVLVGLGSVLGLSSGASIAASLASVSVVKLTKNGSTWENPLINPLSLASTDRKQSATYLLQGENDTVVAGQALRSLDQFCPVLMPFI
jgi:hypothetical protein